MSKICLRSRSVVLFLVVAVMLSFCPIVTSYATSITLDNGGIYTGETVYNSIPNGTGTVAWPDGTKYDGEFFNGMIHGKGTTSYPEGNIYTGTFEYGYRSGTGKMTFTNGDVYDGEWKADMMHGKGKYTFYAPDPTRPTKNDVYNGQWRFNMMHGKGTYRFASGKTTEGYWVMNSYRGTKLTSEIKAEIGALK